MLAHRSLLLVCLLLVAALLLAGCPRGGPRGAAPPAQRGLGAPAQDCPSYQDCRRL